MQADNRGVGDCDPDRFIQLRLDDNSFKLEEELIFRESLKI